MDRADSRAEFACPKTISTQIELEDVDLATIVEKAKKFGIEIPVPIAGRFSIKADGDHPSRLAPGHLKGYVFKGDATLKGASIDHVDLGLVTAHLELVNGVLDLSDFRGQFVDRPCGRRQEPAEADRDPPDRRPVAPRRVPGQAPGVDLAPRGRDRQVLKGITAPARRAVRAGPAASRRRSRAS